MPPLIAYALSLIEIDFITSFRWKSNLMETSVGVTSALIAGESIAEEETDELLDATMATGDEGSSLYRLRGVVVHSGQANGGHYYSFIRSDRGDGKWYKFDDTDVHEHDLSTEDVAFFYCS